MALTYTETIKREATTVVNDVEVARHMLHIREAAPNEMVCNLLIKDHEAYKSKEVRDVIRADHAEFEDAAYDLQAELLAKLESENK